MVHLYGTHVVLEFICCNTLEDQQLEDVVVQVDASGGEGLGEMTLVPAPVLKYGVPARTYVSIARTAEDVYPIGQLACTMKFAVKDVDPSTGEPDEQGFEEDYNLDDLTLGTGTAHLIAHPAEMPKIFKAAWEAVGPDGEIAESYALPYGSCASHFNWVREQILRIEDVEKKVLPKPPGAPKNTKKKYDLFVFFGAPGGMDKTFCFLRKQKTLDFEHDPCSKSRIFSFRKKHSGEALARFDSTWDRHPKW